ncbi:MAG: hypothetical protein E6K60_03890 [Nitrospirae bacterium]|nr:MAG: hypothetical protein E6K60_03890 [Nitrospirota bacterium]
MIEDGLMLANLQGVSVHTLATMAMILFGNILPAGVILTLWWYAEKRSKEAPEPPQPASARIKVYRQAA